MGAINVVALVLTSTEFESTHLLVATFFCCGKVLTSIEFVRTHLLVATFYAVVYVLTSIGIEQSPSLVMTFSVVEKSQQALDMWTNSAC